MTDHADHFPMTKPFDLEDVTVALHNIADAIRGLTPKATQDAPGCPQIDPQPADGRTDGDGGAGATGGNIGRSPHVMVSRDVLVAMETSRRKAIQRAERAEAERDAVLDELRNLEGQWAKEPNILQRGAFVRTAAQLGSIINRHTPEG